MLYPGTRRFPVSEKVEEASLQPMAKGTCAERSPYGSKKEKEDCFSETRRIESLSFLFQTRVDGSMIKEDFSPEQK